MGACELESGDTVPAAIPIRKMTLSITQTLLPTNGRRITMPDAITGDCPELKPVNIGAAAIDIGSKMHVAAVNPTCTDVPVRAFGTFTQDLGVHPSQLRDWVKKLADDPQHAFPGQGQMKPEQLEIAQLKREVTKLKAERDILKTKKLSRADARLRAVETASAILAAWRVAAVSLLEAQSPLKNVVHGCMRT